MLELTALDYQILNDFQEKLNGDKILFGSHYNKTFEDAFLTPRKKIDRKKENYIQWVLNSMDNPLEHHMVEVRPNHFRIDARIAIKHANAVNLTMLIFKRKVALYKEKRAISYEIA